MTGLVVPLQPPSAEVFEPFGRFISPPSSVGERAFYSDVLSVHTDDSSPVLHVNHVDVRSLPMTVSSVERHPYAAQCFVPLDVSRYVVMVMPSHADGTPDTLNPLAFLVPPTMGVIYSPGVWHAGAAVLDRPGHFTVLMWRGGAAPDDEFLTIPQMTIVEKA